MALTTEQREEFVRQVFERFADVHNDRRLSSTLTEYELARHWATRGVPLAVVLQGISETSGKPRRLQACQRAVEENIARWHSAVGGLTSLPNPGLLE